MRSSFLGTSPPRLRADQGDKRQQDAQLPGSSAPRAGTSNNSKLTSFCDSIFLPTRLRHPCMDLRACVCDVCVSVQVLTIFCALCDQTWILTTPRQKDGRTSMPTIRREKSYKCDSSALETQQECKSTRRNYFYCSNCSPEAHSSCI